MSTSVTLPISGPWATAGFTQAYWSSMSSRWFADGGVFGDWVLPGPLQVYADSTGMHVKVKIGAAFWLGQYGELTSEATIDIASNASGNPRIDRISLRRDTTGHTLILTRIAGTAGATPVPPAYTAQDMPLAQVLVGNGVVTIAAANVTGERQFMPLGVTPTDGDSDNYPPAPLAGQLIGDAGDGVTVMKFYDPTVPGWQSLVTGDDTGWTNVTANTAGHWGFVSANPLRVRRIGAIVHLQGSVLVSAAPSTTIVTALPAGGFAPSEYHRYIQGGDVNNLVQITVGTDGSIVWNASETGSIPTSTVLPLDTTWVI